MRTFWYCEVCDRAHYVDHLPQAGAYEVVNRIRVSHQKEKPKCKNTVDRIRLIAVTDFQPLEPA